MTKTHARLAFVVSLFGALFTARSARADSPANPCPGFAVAGARSNWMQEPKMPMNLGGIVVQQKLVNGSGVVESEATSIALTDATTGAAVPFTTTAAGLPGWLILWPDAGLEVAAYKASALVPCTDGHAETRGGTVDVAPSSALPSTLGTVHMGQSFVAPPTNGRKKHFDASSVIVVPTPEMWKFRDVTAWRATAISSDGVRHGAVWESYGEAFATQDGALSLAVSAMCPAKGTMTVEVEAATAGLPTLTSTTTWDVGELSCDDPPADPNAAASGPAAESSNASSCSASPVAPTGGATIAIAFFGLTLLLRRRRA